MKDYRERLVLIMKLLSKQFKKNFSSQAFKSFFSNYLLFIITAFLVCFFLYGFTYNRISKYNEKMYMTTFNHSNDIAMQYISKTEEITSQLNSNPAVNKVLFSDGSDSTAINNLLLTLRTYSNDSYISGICIYNRKNNKAIWSNTAYELNKMYGDLFAAGDMNYDSFYKSCLSEPAYNRMFPQTNFLLNGEYKNCIVSYSSLPLLDNYNIKGNLMIFIDTNVLFDAISQQFKSDNIHIYLYNKESQIARTDNAPMLDSLPTEIKTTMKLDNKKYTVFTSNTSDRYKFVICVPKSVITQPLRGFTLIIVIILLLSTILYFALAIFLSHLNLKPIQNIINQLDTSGIGSEINEYSLINKEIASLISSNRQFQAEYDKMRPIICSDFIQSLIDGQITDRQVIQKTLSNIKPDFISEQYRLLIVSVLDISPTSLSNIERITLSKNLITSRLSESLQYISCNTSATDVAAIIAISSQTDELVIIEEVLNEISLRINKDFPMQFKIALSDKFDSLENAFFSYQNTLDAFNSGTYTTHNNITWCTSYISASSGYYYPIELESKILLSFKHNDRDKIFALLANIRERNLEHALYGISIHYLYHDIKGTIYKIMNSEGISEDDTIVSHLSAMNNNSTVNQFFDIVEKLFEYLLSLTDKENSTDNLSELFIAYINSQYNNPDFGRNDFAQKFHISADYVSKIFKEYTGFQFHSYLTKVRMDNACTLLTEGNYSIEKIALSVGYNSAVAFRRAFKTYTGMTPKEYKHKNE